ncbi:MAG: hypothetical protein MJB57_12675, partial [Gemmatimonadetes bacterium]|nr:hypothetical protein [Gemmatimonadota bacterium]
MSTIDELIASFHAVGAERLLLVSGKAPVLTIDGELGPMGEGAGDAHNEIERDLLEGMILIMGGEAEVGQDEFTYDSPTGQVHVTTRITERVIQVIIVPEGAAPMRPAEPVDPFAQDDEYDAVTPDAGLAEETAGWSDPPAAEGLYSNETDGAAIEPLEGFRPGAPLPTADWGNEAEDASDGLDGASSSDPDEVQHFASDDAGDENPGDERLDAATFSEQPADDGFEAPEPSFEPGPATEFPTVDVSHESSLLEPPTMDEPTDELAIDPEESSGDAACGEPFESEIESDVEPLDQVADTSPPVLELRSDSPAMERLFLKMVGKGCSDLHVSAGAVPLFRKDGRMTDLGGEPRLSAGQAEMLLMGITPDRYRKEFEERNDVDFAYEIPGVARFRCNLFRDRNGIGGVFRQIPADILNAEQLGLHPQLLEMCQLKKGLILVTGPTG